MPEKIYCSGRLHDFCFTLSLKVGWRSDGDTAADVLRRTPGTESKQWSNEVQPG
jgi:hypothetical protein